MAKILAIDWGGKRVGLAIADEVAKIAASLPSLSSGPNLLEQISQICQEQEVAKIVVGLPRGMAGQETAQTATVRRFASELESATGLPLILQDETLTSVISQTGPKPPADIDSAAASLILSDYLISL